MKAIPTHLLIVQQVYSSLQKIPLTTLHNCVRETERKEVKKRETIRVKCIKNLMYAVSDTVREKSTRTKKLVHQSSAVSGVVGNLFKR